MLKKIIAANANKGRIKENRRFRVSLMRRRNTINRRGPRKVNVKDAGESRWTPIEIPASMLESSKRINTKFFVTEYRKMLVNFTAIYSPESVKKPLRQNLWVGNGALSFPNGTIVLSINDQPGGPHRFCRSATCKVT